MRKSTLKAIENFGLSMFAFGMVLTGIIVTFNYFTNKPLESHITIAATTATIGIWLAGIVNWYGLLFKKSLKGDKKIQGIVSVTFSGVKDGKEIKAAKIFTLDAEEDSIIYTKKLLQRINELEEHLEEKHGVPFISEITAISTNF